MAEFQQIIWRSFDKECGRVSAKRIENHRVLEKNVVEFQLKEEKLVKLWQRMWWSFNIKQRNWQSFDKECCKVSVESRISTTSKPNGFDKNLRFPSLLLVEGCSMTREDYLHCLWSSDSIWLFFWSPIFKSLDTSIVNKPSNWTNKDNNIV